MKDIYYEFGLITKRINFNDRGKKHNYFKHIDLRLLTELYNK